MCSKACKHNKGPATPKPTAKPDTKEQLDPKASLVFNIVWPSGFILNNKG